MNPRHRRLLIPGLLLALLVVVLVASLVQRADAAESDVVSRIGDPRVTESSGLVVSAAYPDLAYTVNDSGNDPVVFAVRISTGEVVGTTTIAGGALVDTEALALDADGTLWIADTGDNLGKRDDVALYTLDEPGEGDHSVTATRYPLSYAGGPEDVEAFVIDPATGSRFLITKGLIGGTVLKLPAKLSTDQPNVPVDLDVSMPLMVTDATVTPDGAFALVRTYIAVHVVDLADWSDTRSISIGLQRQGETIAMESSGKSFLLGSEGADSELIRMGFDAVDSAVPAPSTTPAPELRPVADDVADAGSDRTWWYVGGAAVLLVALGLAVRRRARRPQPSPRH